MLFRTGQLIKMEVMMPNLGLLKPKKKVKDKEEVGQVGSICSNTGIKKSFIAISIAYQAVKGVVSPSPHAPPTAECQLGKIN